MSDTAIAVTDLRMRYRGSAEPAVDGMSFRVSTGEIFGLLGPNGAGKSTTQQVLTGQLRGYSGHAVALGHPISAWGPDYYEHIGVGFELPAHFSRLTVRENLAAFAGLYRQAVADPDHLLEQVGLAASADRPAGSLSKGMSMRLNIARALLNHPRLLFLDEPTSGMDPVHSAAIRELIRSQAGPDRTVFLTTHDMATADQLCDRVAFVSNGRIAAIDTPRDFRLTHGRPSMVVEYRENGTLHQMEFPLRDAAESPFVDLLRDRTVETVHTREASLDEVFATVTGGRL